MSPTMSEGSISSWKKKEGEEFAPGDVLLEIETDKATIDVEAQEDGVLGKILVAEGTKNVPVGKTIALLAEEGDDVANLEAPQDMQSVQQVPSATHPVSHQPVERQTIPEPSKPFTYKRPTHSRPLFPSVHRLLVQHGIDEPNKIKGTGIRGMLTKGDVLAYLGIASSPSGTYKPTTHQRDTQMASKEEFKPLDGPTLRRSIVSNMLQSTLKTRSVAMGEDPPYCLSLLPGLTRLKGLSAVDFDSVIGDYFRDVPSKAPDTPHVPRAGLDYLEGLV
ncbi:hypothetical protein AX17_001921 [Amanita inopinata Kibby_2008]|nr:hypothetical protein AX17_001921 [Amanita inopinata Kibby_2008]